MKFHRLAGGRAKGALLGAALKQAFNVVQRAVIREVDVMIERLATVAATPIMFGMIFDDVIGKFVTVAIKWLVSFETKFGITSKRDLRKIK